MKKKNKKNKLDKLTPDKYRIYGIFNFKTNKLVYVNMELEQAELEFDLEDYNPEQFDIVSFDIILT